MLTRRYHQGGEKAALSFIPIVFFICFILVLLLPACSPKIIEKVRTEYVYQDVHHRDTLVTRDSVYIREWLKGDTVYIEKYKDRYVFRDRWRDSVSVREVHDTTAVEVKVEKPLSWSEKARLRLFPWLLLATLGLGAWTTKKWWLPLLR